ncbi:MAG: Kelch repeat-containing protein [Sediminibacterium sp.]
MGLLNKIQIAFVCLCLVVAITAQTKYEAPITWKQSGELPVQPNGLHHMGLSGVVSGVVANQIVIAGGNNFPCGLPWEGGVKKYYDQVFVYDVKGDTLIITDSSVRLPSKVAYAAVAQLKEGIFYAGGENENGPLSSAYFIKKGKQQSFEIIELPHLPIATTNAAAVATENAVYVLGGANKEGVSNKLWKLALNNIKKGWTAQACMPQPTAFTAAAIANEHIYIMGGRCKEANGISKIYKEVYAFDVENNFWKQKASLPETVSAACALAIDNNKILFIGGDKSVVFHEVEMLAAKIAATLDTTLKKELTVVKNNLQKTHPGFSKDVLAYDPALNSWSPYAQLNFTAPVTTITFLFNHKILLPVGEIKPGIRTPYIWVGSFKK